MSLPALLIALSLVQTPGYEDEDQVLVAPPQRAHQGVPAWLPRAVFAGASLNSGVLTPQLRLQWELTMIQTDHDAFVLGIEGGGGHAVAFPSQGFGANGTDSMTLLYQYALDVGVAYRALYSNGFAWGFHIYTGPVVYGAHIQNALPENTLNGWVDGGAQVGLRAGKVVYGIAFRYASIYYTPARSQASAVVGGPFLGFYADWRP